MSWDFQQGELDRKISENIAAILSKAHNVWLDDENYQRFCNLLISGSQRYKEGTAVKVIIISEELLPRLAEQVDVDMLFNDRRFVDNTFIQVDEHLNIVEISNGSVPSNNEEARELLARMSADGCLYFELLPSGVLNRFINGEVISNSPFFSSDEYTKYMEKRPVNQIAEVLEEYRATLSDQNHYGKFFIPKASLRTLYAVIGQGEDRETFVNSHIHWLRPRTEDLFRNDLYEYLRRTLDAIIVNKELVVAGDRRVDISAVDKIEKGIYIIEVKWLGQSISPEGTGAGTAYGQAHIVPDAFNQTVDYIRLLTEDGRDVKKGYLVVFDARIGVHDETGNAMSLDAYSGENRGYVRKFVKISDLKVKNIHPL